MVQRWTLFDPNLDESWTFPVNPNKMTSPHGPRSLQVMVTSPRPGDQAQNGLVLETNRDPHEWTVSGNIRTEDHFAELLYWVRKVNRLQLTDHFGRTWQVRMLHFNPDEQKPSQNRPWRFTYDLKMLNYGEVG